MNVAEQENNPSSGGGVYITDNGGQVVNCVIVFNMDDKGVGIDGKGGESINNTVAYNTQTPTWIDIEGGTFHPYGGSQQLLPATKTRYIHLDPFYIASTECTSGQYACFMSAVDMGSYGGTYPPYLSVADRDSLVKAKAPVPAAYTGYPSGITVSDYAMLDLGGASYAGGSGTTIGGSIWNILQSNVTFNYAGLTASSTSDLSAVWYPVKGGTAAGTGEAQRRDNYAMSNVSWWGSLAFSLWIGGCLPTEAQWEYAARQKENGTTDDSYYYAGATANSDAGLSEVGWWSSNSGSKVHEVAKKKKTGRGLYDMSGNVREWCLDAYDNSFSKVSGVLVVSGETGKDLVSSGSGNGSSVATAKMNPVAISDYNSGSNRVWRGGAWYYSATNCSLGYRSDYGDPNSRNNNIGFRAVCVP
jgi:formylglycine-generating enzyme required for sulfatase activity